MYKPPLPSSFPKFFLSFFLVALENLKAGILRLRLFRRHRLCRGPQIMYGVFMEITADAAVEAPFATFWVQIPRMSVVFLKYSKVIFGSSTSSQSEATINREAVCHCCIAMTFSRRMSLEDSTTEVYLCPQCQCGQSNQHWCTSWLHSYMFGRSGKGGLKMSSQNFCCVFFVTAVQVIAGVGEMDLDYFLVYRRYLIVCLRRWDRWYL